MEEYNIAVYTTAKRSVNYVNDMLKALVKLEKQINMFVDGDTADYIQVSSPFINIHLLEVKELDSWLPKHRAAYNYCRCLTFQPEKALLIFEDDVVIKDDFLARLERSLAKIEDNTFLLSLSHSWRELGQPLVPESEVIQRYVAETTQRHLVETMDINTNEKLILAMDYWQFTMWAGLQCTYYPAGEFRCNIADYIMKECPPESISGGDEMFDFKIGRYCYNNQIPIYLTTETAATHIGMVRAIA